MARTKQEKRNLIIVVAIALMMLAVPLAVLLG